MVSIEPVLGEYKPFLPTSIYPIYPQYYYSKLIEICFLKREWVNLKSVENNVVWVDRVDRKTRC